MDRRAAVRASLTRARRRRRYSSRVHRHVHGRPNNRVGPGRLYVSFARGTGPASASPWSASILAASATASAPGPLMRYRTDAPAIRVDEVRRDRRVDPAPDGIRFRRTVRVCAPARSTRSTRRKPASSGPRGPGEPRACSISVPIRPRRSSAEARLSAAHDLRRGLMSPRNRRSTLQTTDLRAERQAGTDVAPRRRHRRVQRRGRAVAATPPGAWAFGSRPRARSRKTSRRFGREVYARLMIFAAGESTAHYVRMFAGNALNALLRHDALQLVQIDGGDHVFSSPGVRASDSSRKRRAISSASTRRPPSNPSAQSYSRTSSS